ncbi:MAG: hypothetical protein ACRDPZ_02775, partial [Gaiellaceae bacterium]
MSDTKGEDMTLYRSLVAVVALTAAIATSAIGAGTGASTALAAPAGASPFALTAEYRTGEPWWEYPDHPHEGTFAARAPFCRSGTAVVLTASRPETRHRFTCDDGSGSLVVSIAESPFGQFDTTSWRILEGTGRYASLRGKGSSRTEILDDPDGTVTFWNTLEGVAAEDAIAPAIGFSSVKVAKLPRPAGAYSLKLAIDLRDDVEANPVSYLLRVTPTT